jgi:hypothetical protein
MDDVELRLANLFSSTLETHRLFDQRIFGFANIGMFTELHSKKPSTGLLGMTAASRGNQEPHRTEERWKILVEGVPVARVLSCAFRLAQARCPFSESDDFDSTGIPEFG